jgi:uncharacterized membrane protein SirB2
MSPALSYAVFKHLHLAFVGLSGLLFVGRGLLMLQNSPALQQRWLRIVPHVVDTLLLASAVALAVTTHQYPGTDNWLSAKLVGLVVYIVLGTVALKAGRTRGVRAAAFVGALLAFAYIVAVAITKSPMPW